MKSILYSIYTGEYPNQFAGGPNNIIYKIINTTNRKVFEFDYLSSDLFFENITQENINDTERNRSTKKKIASFLANKTTLYLKVFGSDLYLPYHFYKKERYFNKFGNQSKKYNIIHSHDSVSLALLDNQKFNNVKKIFTVHSKGPLSDEYRNIANSKILQLKINKRLTDYEYKSIGIADIITFPSIAAKNYFEESLNVSLENNKVKIIYNGIEFEKIQNIKSENIFEKYSIDKNNKLILLNIAAHGREKRIDVLLDVVNKLTKKYNIDILLINIGEGSDTKELTDLTQKLNIKNNVKFLGKIPNKDVIGLLKAADIFIMTSEKVIFDLVVLEALASGTCCVVSNNGGNKEIIRDGENGYLIDIDDVDKIAKKIISINPNKVKANAIKTAKQFTVQKMVKEYFDLYEGLSNGI